MSLGEHRSPQGHLCITIQRRACHVHRVLSTLTGTTQSVPPGKNQNLYVYSTEHINKDELPADRKDTNECNPVTIYTLYIIRFI